MTPVVYQSRESHKPEPSGRDHCQSPPYAILPLLPYLPKYRVIWEPALGEGYMAQAFRDHGYRVVTSSLESGLDFFEYRHPGKWDIIITNPPWSLTEKWMERCFELGKPFALLLKTDAIQNVGIQRLCQRFGDIEHIHPDSRIDYKMPNKGWQSGGAPFNTHWYTFGLNIGKVHTYLSPIKSAKKNFKLIQNGQYELIGFPE